MINLSTVAVLSQRNLTVSLCFVVGFFWRQKRSKREECDDWSSRTRGSLRDNSNVVEM